VGAAAGFGGIGKIISPLSPGVNRRIQQLREARRAAKPDFHRILPPRRIVRVGRCRVSVPRIETKGRSIEQIDRDLVKEA
jgi:hypothetical protein